MNRILVIGGTGNVGRQVVYQLAAAGARFRAMTRNPDVAGWPPQVGPHCYVCGPTPFVEAVADALVGLGHAPASVKTERFGPTGG